MKTTLDEIFNSVEALNKVSGDKILRLVTHLDIHSNKRQIITNEDGTGARIAYLPTTVSFDIYAESINQFWRELSQCMGVDLDSGFYKTKEFYVFDDLFHNLCRLEVREDNSYTFEFVSVRSRDFALTRNDEHYSVQLEMKLDILEK